MATHIINITGNSNDTNAVVESTAGSINDTGSAGTSCFSGQHDSITFMLNSKKLTIKNPDPTESLLDFLRYKTQFTGTRKFCNQGGCGVCIVMLSYKDPLDGLLRNVSINSCLKRLVQCNGCAITTTEGIGNSKVGFHAVQEQISLNQGLQCGACTPGQVMSIYSALQPNTLMKTITTHSNKAEKLLDGNLCRCSCYLGIIKTAKSFGPDKNAGSDYSSSSDVNATNTYSDFLNNSTLSKSLTYKSSVFDVTYHVVKTVAELSVLATKYGLNSIIFINGGTSAGIYGKEYGKSYVDVRHLSELNKLTSGSSNVVVGANVPYNKVINALKTTNNSKLLNVAEHLYHIAGQSVRNSGGLGGALAMTKLRNFLSDSVPCLLAAGASVNVIKITLNNVSSLVSMSVAEYLDYSVNNEKLLVVDITIPFGANNEYFNSFRISKRKVNAVSLINAAFNYTINSSNVVESCKIVYGAVKDGKPVEAINTSAYLVGKSLNQTTLDQALTLIQSDIVVETMTDYKSLSKPTGKKAERQKYVKILLYKSVLQLQKDLGLISTVNNSGLSIWNDDITVEYERVYGSDPNSLYLNQPAIKSDSKIIASGEAKYTDDVPTSDKTLFGRIVFTSVASGKVNVNSNVTKTAVANARATTGVELVLTCWEDDINLSPSLGGFIDNSNTKIYHNGTVVAVVFATSPDLAEKVGSEMVLEYVDVESNPNLSLEYAIENKMFKANTTVYKVGNNADELPAYLDTSIVDLSASGVKTSDHIAEDELDMADLLHFYLENNSCTVTKDAVTGKYLIYTSSQATGTVKYAPGRLGLRDDQYIIKTNRVGGGFGGKILIGAIPCLYALMGAMRTDCNVKLLLSLDQETNMLNGRPRIYQKQKVGFNTNGKINSVRKQQYQISNGGPDFFNGTGAHILPYTYPNMYAAIDTVDIPRGFYTFHRGASRPEKNTIKAFPIDIVAGALGKRFDDVMKVNVLEDLSLASDPSWVNDPAWTANSNDNAIFKTMIDKLHTGSKYRYVQRVSDITTFNTANKWKKRALVTVPGADSVGSYVGDLLLGSKESVANITFNTGELYGYFAGTLKPIALDDSYRVRLTIEGTEMGQGIQIKMQQVFAHYMECPLDYTTCDTGATDTMPTGNGLGAGSQGTIKQQESVKRLALQFKKLWGELDASDNLVVDALSNTGLQKYGGVGSAELGISGEVWAAYTDKEKLTKTWEYRVRKNQNHLAGKYNLTGNSPSQYGVRIPTIYMSEVEVDCLTGQTTVREINSISDLGKTPNPAIDAGQMEGGAIFGIGAALTEGRYWNDQNMPMNNDTWTYKIPSVYEVPHKMINELHNASTALPLKEFPTKSNNEGGVFVSTSIFFAVKEAIRSFRKDNSKSGNFRLDMPATPDIVLKALDLENAQLTLA